ncbi:TlyA family RNA methyltransferase [Candidatus Leptofilum sp.]|uniref:TlyA family RNA methyltransferase n=1 Tax=Candidatus Leptofilum sp. TaxID=3241576 RepID=UPI003B5B5B3D
MAKKKERLDKLLVEREFVSTRSKAQGIILAGEVLVDGKMVDKPGTAVPIASAIELKAPLPYVGRGGFKLAGALETFNLDVMGAICADVGACTGGFTDVLLQNGAARVYAIDVGYGQLDWMLRQDERVVVMERTNARYLEKLDEPVNFVAIDVSFISLRLILPAVKQWLADDASLVALIKPQFEAGPKQVGRGGIVKDTAVHRAVLLDLWHWFRANNFAVQGLTRSPVTGAEGNVEFLVWLKVGGEDVVPETAVEALLTEADVEN